VTLLVSPSLLEVEAVWVIVTAGSWLEGLPCASPPPRSFEAHKSCISGSGPHPAEAEAPHAQEFVSPYLLTALDALDKDGFKVLTGTVHASNPLYSIQHFVLSEVSSVPTVERELLLRKRQNRRCSCSQHICVA
jgi:hypothetical protein